MAQRDSNGREVRDPVDMDIGKVRGIDEDDFFHVAGDHPVVAVNHGDGAAGGRIKRPGILRVIEPAPIP